MNSEQPRVFKVSAHCEMAVWDGRLPDSARIEPANTEAASIETDDAPRAGRSVAIDARIAHGGRSSYALLGGVYQPHEAKTLELFATPDDQGRRHFSESRLGFHHQRLVGLPADYARGVASAFLAHVGHGIPAPRGKISITHAVHDFVESSHEMFGRVARCWFGVVLNGVPIEDSERLQALASAALHPSGAPRQV